MKFLLSSLIKMALNVTSLLQGNFYKIIQSIYFGQIKNIFFFVMINEELKKEKSLIFFQMKISKEIKIINREKNKIYFFLNRKSKSNFNFKTIFGIFETFFVQI